MSPIRASPVIIHCLHSYRHSVSISTDVWLLQQSNGPFFSIQLTASVFQIIKAGQLRAVNTMLKYHTNELSRLGLNLVNLAPEI